LAPAKSEGLAIAISLGSSPGGFDGHQGVHDGFDAEWIRARRALAAALGMKCITRNLRREVGGASLIGRCGGRVSKRSAGGAVALTRSVN